jgi:hypothetical protein
MKVIFGFLIFFSGAAIFAQSMDYRNSNRFSPNEYLFKQHGLGKDPIFDQYRSVELNVDLGIGSDCGRINFDQTLRASLKNLLDAKYFGDMGRNIIASSPMLLTCYMSPTWCSILKNMRLKANMLAGMRLDQCSLVDKYVDSRVEDFYRERQQCVHKAIQNNGGDMETAMEDCKNYWDADLSNWAGNKFGKSQSNKLLESSAKWQGMTDNDSNDLLGLVKSVVGDSVITRGNVSVDYGPRSVKLTPRTYLSSLRQEKFQKISGLLKKVENAGMGTSVYRVVTEHDLKELNGDVASGAVDYETLQSLLFMPYRVREAAMTKLSDALAMPTFTEKMSQSLDFMTRVTQNVNLPDNRKTEAEQKRKALKEQIEMTMLLEGKKSEPLNTVLKQISEEGQRYENVARGHRINTNAAVRQGEATKARLKDCADDILCGD